MTDRELIEALHAARRKARMERAAQLREERRYLREQRLIDKYKNERLLPYLIPAMPADYALWLADHIRRGGKITHVYDYPMSREQWYVAASDITFEMGLMGSNRLLIIVPQHYSVRGPLGHCQLYIEGRAGEEHDFVPIYSDTRF